VERAPGHPEIARIVAPNPGPMTLEGTNTYLVNTGDGCLVIDPGPADPGHVERIETTARELGGIAGVVLTHSHADHSLAAPLIAAPLLLGTVSSAAEGSGDAPDGDIAAAPSSVGPLEVVPTPGHAADHVALLLGDTCFCGDLVLGRGSSFVPPNGGSLAAYLESLRLVREIDPALMCPGHGPWITDPRAKLEEYIEHRLERERRLVGALEAGERSRQRLLAAAWSDVPEELRPAAAVVMEAHLQKLEAEDRLPDGVGD
jgi:glyoxylase-like metal-dependent hydrolase (beta-lactamase superfamily II)